MPASLGFYKGWLCDAVESGEDFGRLGADAEVGVSLGEGDDVMAIDDEGSGQGEAPALFSGIVIVEACVIEGDIDEDGLEVAALLCGERVGKAELLGNAAASVGEQREG